MYSYNGILQRGKKSTTDTPNNTDQSQDSCAEGKEPKKKSTYCMVPFA